MSDPNPYAALERVQAMRRPLRDKLLRLVVWCEWYKCSPIRVYKLREGILVQCRSDANVSDIPNHYPPHRDVGSPSRVLSERVARPARGSAPALSLAGRLRLPTDPDPPGGRVATERSHPRGRHAEAAQPQGA